MSGHGQVMGEGIMDDRVEQLLSGQYFKKYQEAMYSEITEKLNSGGLVIIGEIKLVSKKRLMEKVATFFIPEFGTSIEKSAAPASVIQIVIAHSCNPFMR